MHVVRAPGATVLLDCGLFQGRRREAFQKNSRLAVDATAIDVCVLSHAHIDHSGALPILFKNGFTGNVWVTPATRDLLAVMLEDAAMIQQQDARYINREIERGNAAMDPVDPLYSPEDVTRAMRDVVALPYRKRQVIAPGVTLTLLDAGHVLGSAIVVLDVDDAGKTRRIVFTGDLGRRHMPILRDPEIPSGGEFLITESTYGDRLHSPIEQMDDDLAGILARTHARGGKVVIPSFALERAQEIVFALKRLRKQGRMPPMRVYVDSPLTVKITDVFRMHPDCMDEDTREWISGSDSPFDFPGLTYVSDVEESKQLDMSREPAVII